MQKSLPYFPDPIPAPKNVQYNTSNGVFHWSPPCTEEMPDNSNVSVALRIIHYVIYVTDLQSGLLITNFTTTGPETSTKLNISILDAMPRFPCSMSIQVSAVNPAGEGQRSTSITENRKSKNILCCCTERYCKFASFSLSCSMQPNNHNWI